MGKANLNELTRLRKLYESEKQRREDYYSEMIKQAKDDYIRSQDIDYVDEFKEEFDVSLISLERLYDELVEIYSVTKGLTFSITGYIKTVNPRTIAKGKVEEHFDMLVEECKGALEDINNSISPEDDIEPIKVFCQGLIDLRYIVKNARQLITEAGNAEQKKQARLNQLKKRIDDAKDEYNQNTMLESFDCYSQLKEYADNVNAGSRVVADSVLQNDKISPRNDFKFLMGFHTESIPEEDLKFANSVLGIDSSAFSTNPIFFDLKPGHTSLLINAPAAYFSEFDFNQLIKNIYFSFATNLPAKDLLITGVEHESVTDSILASLESTIKKEVNDNKSDDGIYRSIAKKDDEIINLIGDIKTLTNLRSTIYLSNDVKDIFSYNELDALSTDFYILYLVNHYPYGFTNTRINGAEELKRMATSNGLKGVITVICQATDANYTEAMPMLKAEDLGADCIEVSLENVRGMVSASYKYNGEPASLNIRAPKGQFDEKTYWKKYAKFFNNASIVWFYDILDKFSKTPAKPIYEQISIPVGFSEGVPFEYKIDTCSTQDFGIITGKSGSGKSSFLHTLILGAASRYSPDELRIRLVDFKAETDSPEFSQYKKIKGKDNLYIPHVDYLLVNGKSECALDLFKMIKGIKTERNEIMGRIGLSEYSRYMKDERVQRGDDPNLPKLPFLLYIIDEYNLMIDGNKRSSSVKQTIIDEIADTVRAVRAYGVGVLLSGQTVADDIDNALSQMDSRIALMNNSVMDYQALMGKPSREEANVDLAFLRGKGYSVFSTDAGKTRRRVRHAYAGFTGCDEQKEFTKKIREKYGETEQIIAGGETKFNICEETAINESVVGNGKKQMFIPIGVTSASMIKSYLNFSDGKAALNYFAFADIGQLYELERNAMFGFLNEMVNIGYKNPSVTYFAEDGSVSTCLGEFLDKYPTLEKHFRFFKSHDQIAREIVELHDIYMERNNIKSKDSSKVFEPIFVVMHDVEWLSDRDDSWVRYANEDESDESEVVVQDDSDDELWEQAEQVVNSNKAYSKFNDVMKKSLIKQMVDEMKGEKKSKPKKTKTDRSNFSASDYAEMFNTLYTRGNRYGVYMLVCSENYTPISKSVLDGMEAKEADSAKNVYSIYGSEKEYTDEIRDNGAIKDCVYVCSSSAKTRLYDYSLKNNAEFWENFVNKIN